MGNKIYHERFYRDTFDTKRFQSIRIQIDESDMWIGFNAHGNHINIDDVKSCAEKNLFDLRNSILAYAREHSGFIESLEPLSQDENAPAIIRSMITAAAIAEVGPMASVAGVLAECVGKTLDAEFHLDEIVVENGGDFWIKINSPLSIGVYAGLSSLSGKIAVDLDSSISPLGLACSSGTVGPSLSYGKADAALVIAKDAGAADAWATALGNKIKSKHDLEEALNWLMDDESKNITDETLKPLGVLIILGDTMAAKGNIILRPTGTL